MPSEAAVPRAHAPVQRGLGQRARHRLLAPRLVRPRARGQVVGQRLVRAEEDDADADAGREEHGRPARRGVLRLLPVQAQRDLAVPGERQDEQEHHHPDGQQGEQPAGVEHHPVEGRARDGQHGVRLQHAPHHEADHQQADDGEDHPVHAVAHPAVLHGHARHEGRVDAVRIGELADEAAQPGPGRGVGRVGPGQMGRRGCVHGHTIGGAPDGGRLPPARRRPLTRAGEGPSSSTGRVRADGGVSAGGRPRPPRRACPPRGSRWSARGPRWRRRWRARSGSP